MTIAAQPIDTRPLIDPVTYETGPPFELLGRLRSESPVVWVDEPALHGQPAGSGFWLVLRHADVEQVLRGPGTYSSWLGATQVRDAAGLDWGGRLRVDMDPPYDAEHGSAGPLAAPAAAQPLVHPARRGGGDGRDRGHRGPAGRPDVRRRVGGCLRLREGRRRRPATAHPGRGARRAGRGSMAVVRLVEPRHRLAGPRLHRLDRLRRNRWHDHGP